MFNQYFTARHSLLQGGQLSEHVLLVEAFTADGLFIGQTDGFFDLVRKLAREADAATRKCDAE
jgi:hypothetical protein